MVAVSTRVELHAVDWATDMTECGVHVDMLPEGSEVKGAGNHPHDPDRSKLPLCAECWPNDGGTAW